MQFSMPCKETKRLYLRPLEEADACDMYAYLCDERVVRYLSLPIHCDVDVTLDRMKRELLPYQELGDFEVLAIILKKTERMIGHLYLHSLQKNSAQLAYALHPNYWKQGYAKEAVMALLDIGFSTCQLQRIEAIYEVNHQASAHLLASCGFHKADILRQHAILSDGDCHDMVRAFLLKEEYKGEAIYEKRIESEI